MENIEAEEETITGVKVDIPFKSVEHAERVVTKHHLQHRADMEFVKKIAESRFDRSKFCTKKCINHAKSK